MAPLQLRVLGPPRLERDSKPLALPLRRAVALLVYLAVTGQPQSRETLATLLWPESDEREARGRLRRTLHRLVEVLGDDVLATEGDALRVAPDADLSVDCRAFQDHVAAGLAPSGEGAALDGDRLRHLTEAAELYVDDFLAGFTLPDSPAWDEWQFLLREHLRQRLGQVLALLIEGQRSQGRWEAATAAARRWVGLDPLHEPAQRALMRTYAEAGQQAAALRQYQECVRLLDAELGVEPEAETTTLYGAIRTRRLTAPPPVTPNRPPLLTSVPETRYARSGDVSIAYQVVGVGPVDLVFVMGWVSHLDYFWEEPSFARFLRRLASFSRLILFDKRGTGLSDRAVGLPTLEQRMDDVRAVMDAVGSERAAIVGASEGGSMSILFAATYPERTASLVLLGCFPRRLWAPDFPWVVTREERAEYWRRLEEGWGTVAWAREDVKRRAPSAMSDEAFQHWWATYLRMSASPGAALAMSRMNAEIDVRHVLPSIRVPTLIIHQKGDQLAPVEGARYMAERIPGARYRELPGDDHLPFVGDQDVTLAEIEGFVTGAQVPPEPDTVLLTLLVVRFSNTSDHPPGFSDRAERQRRDDLQAAVHRELSRFRGNEIEATDDRLLATFDGPARAIRCASAITGATRVVGLEVRVGLHTGECELVDGRIRGVALQIAEDVATRAKNEEVLVSGTVKDLVAGSGIQFEDLGTHPLTTPLEERRLFRVHVAHEEARREATE